jgi:hypothetical protein
MYEVYEIGGNSGVKIADFDDIVEAQDFVINKAWDDVKVLKKDDPEVDEDELLELAMSYYTIQEKRN